MKKWMLLIGTFVLNFGFATLAMAQEHTTSGSNAGWIPIGAGLTMGLAALGGTLGQGRAVAAAVEGVARNPGAASKVQTPMILGLALIESLVIFSFVIAIMLTNKV